MVKDMEFLTIVPARGGSKRVKHKNLLPVAGLPLVTRTVNAVHEANEESGEHRFVVYVSTDDPQIEAVVDAPTLKRRNVNARDEATIADVVFEVVDQVGWDGPVIVLQPTSLITGNDILTVVRYWSRYHEDKYVATISNCHGFHWAYDPDTDHDQPLFEHRANTQFSDDLPVVKENGAIRIFPQGEGDYSRNPDELFLVDTEDIDTWSDLVAARIRATDGSVTFDVLADMKHGSGHLYRCMSIAEELQGFDVGFIASHLDKWAIELLESRGHHMITEYPSPAGNRIWVNDRLDTTREEVGNKVASGYRVINFEDRGSGAQIADLTINAMYPSYKGQEAFGPDWAIIRPEFLVDQWEYRVEGDRVMVLFGGTDPKDLTFSVASWLRELASQYMPLVMTGPGYDGAYDGPRFRGSVVEAMKNSDLLITSGGRTVFEAAAFGIPTVVIAQNLREVSHTHIGEEAGNIYLGLADAVSREEFMGTVRGLLMYPEPRLEMSARAKSLVDGKGLRRVVRTIEDMMEGLI